MQKKNATHKKLMFLLLLGLTWFANQAAIAGEQVITIDQTGIRGVANCAKQPVDKLEQRYLLVDAPEASPAKGVLLMFPGGGGKLGLADNQLKITTANFLLRSRYLFAAQGYHVAVMDAASDFLVCSGGLSNRRTSGKFTKDMQAVASDLRARYPGLTIWLVGTSRGTIAAAQGAAFITPRVDGLILTSSMTNPIDSTVFDTPLGTITVPTMLVAHHNDGCYLTPPAGVELIKQALISSSEIETKIIYKGFPALSSNPCSATTPHGYLGKEPKVARKITRWIREVESD